ncbi:unnamed protein product [Eruca vesicaria subsp. sativa]|uniref:WEB family protein n=1 Tax=Eruca vesicaria subsp. sativa TaxID=29727 RepID=A0ABC8M9L6_ERUVS|nr:unnamed protein product [Eruca vesicaria subsp. sativa]
MYCSSVQMEAMEENDQVWQHHVDTSRPFSSVKEAVATFGQRIKLTVKTHTLNSKLVSPIASPSISQTTKPVSTVAASPRISHAASLPSSSWKLRPSLPSSPQGPEDEFMEVLKKLEAEITETRAEMRMLKERELETDVALASLNAELHKNMSKMAKADAAGECEAVMAKTVSFKETKEKENGEEERRKELMRRMQNEYISLAQILDSNKGNRDVCFGETKTNGSKKKKPIVPLLGDFFFFKKKVSTTENSEPLFTTSSTLRF